MAVNMTVFSAFGKEFKNNLEQYSNHDKQANAIESAAVFVRALMVGFINFGEQMHDGEWQQEWAAERQQ